MIRKKRETTQVDLFDSDRLIRENQNAETSGSLSENGMNPINLIETGNPILMGNHKHQLQKNLPAEESGELISFDQILGEHQNNQEFPETESVSEPSMDPGTDDISVKPLIEEDTDDVIINKDFADGFFPGRPKEGLTDDTRTNGVLRHRRQKRYMKLVVIGALLAALVLALNWNEWITQSSMFTLKTIEVQGCEITSRNEVIDWSGLRTGVRLGTIDGPAVAAQLKKQPYFRQAVVSRHYPSTVRILVEERKPVAFIALDNLHAMDADGIILPKLKTVRSYNLPVVTGIRAAVKTGSELKTPGIAPIRQFLHTAQSRYPALYFELSEIEYSKDALKIFMNAWPFPFLADPEMPERSLVYLEAVAETFRRNPPGKRVREIDLRYENKMIIREK